MGFQIERKRLLLPISTGLFITPFIWEDAHNLIGFGFLYFLGIYFILFNYPFIGIFLSSKPCYIEDIEESNYKEYYIGIQNLFISILFGIIIDSIFINMNNKDLIELFALLGGNIALFIRIQSLLGKSLLLIISYYSKRNANI